MSVLTGTGVDQLEREICLQLPAHPTEDQLDLDTVAHHHAQQVVHIASLSQAEQIISLKMDQNTIFRKEGIPISHYIYIYIRVL